MKYSTPGFKEATHDEPHCACWTCRAITETGFVRTPMTFKHASGDEAMAVCHLVPALTLAMKGIIAAMKEKEGIFVASAVNSTGVAGYVIAAVLTSEQEVYLRMFNGPGAKECIAACVRNFRETAFQEGVEVQKVIIAVNPGGSLS